MSKIDRLALGPWYDANCKLLTERILGYWNAGYKLVTWRYEDDNKTLFLQFEKNQ